MILATFLLLFVLLWLFFRVTGPFLEHVLARSANLTARFRYRDYLPVLVTIAIGVLAAAAAGDGFLDLAESVREGSSDLRQIDENTHAWARAAEAQDWTPFFVIMTVIGTPVGLAVLVALLTAVLAARQRWRWAGYLVFTCVVGGVLNLLLKEFFARARPNLAEALRDAHGYSFPSGHAMGATVVFGAIAYLAFRMLHAWPARAAALAGSFTMIAAIAASRVYLGVHWISDIGAGIAAGAIWVTATTVAYEASRRIRLVRAFRRKKLQ